MLRPLVGEDVAALLRHFSLAAVIFAISTILSLISRVVGMAWLGHCAMVVVVSSASSIQSTWTNF